MTETHHEQDQQPRPGVATENLRSYERLRRSVTDRKIAGVAGGLGRHLNIDPTVLRVLFVVLAFFGGAGLVLYGAAWLIVPEEGSEHSVVRTSPSTRNALLIVVAVLAALLLIGDSWGGFGFPWPLFLIGIIVMVVLVNRDRAGGSGGATEHTPPMPPAPPVGYGWVGGPQPTAEATGPAEPGDTGTTSDSQENTTMTEPTQTYGGTGTLPPPPPPGGGYTWPTPGAPYQPPVKADRGPKLFGPTLALIALALGVLGLYDTTGGSVVGAAYPALALAVIGVMLLVGSVVGRPGGLIFLGVVAALVLGVSAAAGGNWSTDRTVSRAPALAADVRPSYDIGAGQIRLDLTRVADPQNLDGRSIDLQGKAGELLVIVPDNMTVDVSADIQFGGEVEVDGNVQNGNDVHMNRTLDGGTGAPEVNLQLDLLVGHIVVRQEDAA